MARRAMVAAEEVITQMEDSLVLEEASLDFRAKELRRQSLETFKIVGDVRSLKSALFFECYEPCEFMRSSPLNYR